MNRVATHAMTLLVGLVLTAVLQAQPANAPVQPTGLYGVKLAEPDLSRAVAFYALLGMRTGRTSHNGDVQEMVWAPPAGGSNLSLFRDDHGSSGLVAGGVSIVVQVADTRASIAALKMNGFSIVAEPRASGRAMIAVAADPGGNKIEIVSLNHDAN
jgi:predicted enzyme related to lactoylglutathione lyase